MNESEARRQERRDPKMKRLARSTRGSDSESEAVRPSGRPEFLNYFITATTLKFAKIMTILNKSQNFI